MKASAFIYNKLNCAPGVYMLKSCKKRNLKRINLANQETCTKNKLKRLKLKPNFAGKEMPKNDKLLEKEGHYYTCLKNFKYILVYSDVCYVI